MADLKICRICLRTQCKVYQSDRFQLKSYYEEVIAMKMGEKDCLPHYFCYECATMLHKFHKFKEKCYIGLKTLKEISWTGLGVISYESVYKIDRAALNLKSPLEILTVNKRVKTYVTSDKLETTESETESIQAEDEKEINLTDIETKDVFLNDDSNTDNHFSDGGIDDSKDVITEGNDAMKLDDIEDCNVKTDKTRGSPKTVFIDVKKDIVELKSEPVKVRKEYGVKIQNPNHRKVKTRYLDTNNWKKFTLSEEEAVKEFQFRAHDAKYVNAAFKCVDCFKGFSKEDMLKRHKHLRHNESIGSLECRFCHIKFKWDCQLRKHLREHFTRYKCLICNLLCCAEATAYMHEEYHKGVTKKCIHCGEEFRHSSTYYTHLRTHRSEYICTLCGRSFVSPIGLDMHKKVKHINNEIESPDDDEEVNTYCEKCEIRFETRKAFEEHLFHSTMHTEGVEDELDEYSVPRKILSSKLKDKITNSLKRKKPLDEVFPPRDGRRKHRRCFKKPTTCHQCGKYFETQAACMKHHLAEHPRTSFFAANERHICEICGTSLAPGSIAMHQNMHTKKKMFPCETCGRTFHSNVGLKRHLLTHTGEKPFACSLCEKRFTQSNSMKLHYRTFHLKQPYPKRNRRKKKEDPPEVVETEQKSGSEESDSLPEPLPARGTEPATESHEDMHYLTLS